MIRTAKVVSDESKDDEVGLYNTVDVYFEDDDETETYKIVTTIRGNSLKWADQLRITAWQSTLRP